MKTNTKKIALCGVMCALAFAFSYIEFLIPFDMIGIPGIKPGFANLVIMAALYTLGLPYAAFISFVRIALSWLIFGNITSLLYSLAGGILSLLLMFTLKKFKVFDEIGAWIDFRTDCLGFRFSVSYENDFTRVDGSRYDHDWNFGFFVYLRALGPTSGNPFHGD